MSCTEGRHIADGMKGSRNLLEMYLLPLVSYSEIATGGVLVSHESREASSLFIVHCKCLGSWAKSF